jgi:hypothetical protein
MKEMIKRIPRKITKVTVNQGQRQKKGVVPHHLQGHHLLQDQGPAPGHHQGQVHLEVPRQGHTEAGRGVIHVLGQGNGNSVTHWP